MIDECMQDLITKLKSTSLGESVGATLGAGEADPTKSKLPPPFAWVVFSGASNVSDENRPVQLMRLTYRVILVMKYGEGENDYINNKLGLIEEVAQAVRGTPGPQETPLWQFDGVRVGKFTSNRVLYDLSFSVRAQYKRT